MRGRVLVTLNPGVLDPAGQAVAENLRELGFDAVQEVRIGKVIHVELGEVTADQARTQLEAMAKQLLANLVIEDFRVELD